MKPDITIIYIASPSYSGSTLLSRLLHAHSEIISVGELRVLGTKIPRDHLLEKRQCTCSITPLKDCPFWQEVDKALDRNFQLELSQLDLDAADTSTFIQHNQAFFTVLHKVSGKKIIVDSSKNIDRLSRLQEHGFKVVTIQLQRQPQGVIFSGLKYDVPWFRTGLHYWMYYQNLYELVGPNPIRIKYELLAQAPEEELAILMHQLGYNFEKQQMNWAQKDTHYIGGNPMRFQKDNRIQLDQKWKQELNWSIKLFASLIQVALSIPSAWQYRIFILGLWIKQLFTVAPKKQ